MNRKVKERPNCCFHCSTCKEPDCTYDGDYVSKTEERAAARQDRRALWYRRSWVDIEHENKAHVRKERKKFMRATDHNTIDLSISEAETLHEMGFKIVVENGEVQEIIHEILTNENENRTY